MHQALGTLGRANERGRRWPAFSDGVFAIAITLLVLDLAVPDRHTLGHGSLANALGHQWPSYFAYLVSFLVIGIIWVNHHALLAMAPQVDRLVLFANLFLLLAVSTIPWPTRLVADYLTADGSNSHTAAAVYSCVMVAMSIGFTALFLAIVRDDRLTHHPIDAATIRHTLLRFSFGGVIYAATVGLAFVNAIAALAVQGGLALYYCFDQLSRPRT